MVLEASSEFRAYPTHTVSLICNKAARASERGVCQDAHHGGWDPINTQSLDAAAKSAHTFCKRIHVIYRVCHCLLSLEVMLIVVSNFCMDFQFGPHSATNRNMLTLPTQVKPGKSKQDLFITGDILSFCSQEKRHWPQVLETMPFHPESSSSALVAPWSTRAGIALQPRLNEKRCPLP